MNQTAAQANPLKGVYRMLAVLLAAVLGCVILCAATLAMTMRAVSEEETAQETRENDVIIAEEYPILSTEHISDAYKTGGRDQLNDRDKETLDMAAQVLEEVVTDGMSPYDKEKAVFEWMLDNLGNDAGLLTVIPSTQQDAHDPYGVLKHRSAVCVGYATTFRLFMQMLDIPCMVIHNSEAYHSWNLVELDGEWYHVDVYGAAGTGSFHSFNAPDSMVAQQWDQDFFPAAVGMKYNPAYLEAEEVEDLYKIPKLLRETLDCGEEMLSLKFDSAVTEDRLEVAESMVVQVESLLATDGPYLDTLISHTWCPVDNGTLLVIYLISTVDEPDALDGAEQEQIDAAIHEAFGDLELVLDPSEDLEDSGADDIWADEPSVTVYD